MLITGHNIYRGYDGTFVVYYFVSHTIYVVDKYTYLQCAVILVFVIKGMNYSIFFKF